MSGRKWTLALWAMTLGTLLAAAGVVGWVTGQDGALGILGQGLGLITLIFGGYSAANVSQKNVVGKHYRPELDDRGGGDG